MKPYLFAIPLLLLLSACGHVEEVRSARQEQAIEFNQRAQRAFMRGEYQSAAELYEQALRLDIAIENADGIAINSLNLARVHQALGDAALAQRYLDSLLEDKALHFAPVHLASAALQRSLLRLRAGDVTGAEVWADKAAAWCVAGCALGGVIANARASAALQAQDAAKALQWAERGLSENGGVPLEHANSFRLAAAAHLLRNEADVALKQADEALVIDKSLGLPEKIRQDLLLSAQAHEKLGRPEQAAQCRERAARIAATAVK